MGCEHKKLRHRLEDVEKLRLYVKATSKHRALKESLDKAKSRFRYWEWKAKEGSEKIMGSEKERDEAKEEALVARLTTVAAGNAKAKVEGDLARVKDVQVVVEEAKTIVEEARHKANAEAACLEVDRTSFMLELGTAKDEVSSLQSQVSKDKEAMEEEYQKALEVIFAYSYGCCVFKHNICED